MKYAKLTLSGPYRETAAQTHGLSTAARREGFRFDQFFLKTEAIINNRKISKVLIECRQDFSTGLFSGLEEIRERLDKLQASGKEVYFFAHTYGGLELFLSSACSYRVMHPMGSVKFFGLSQSFLFAKRMMRRFGIDAGIIRRGAYKSAGDMYRRDTLDDAVREQYEHYLSSVFDVIKDGIISGFDKTADDLDLLLNGVVLTASAAADAGWIDEIVSIGEFVSRWDKQKDREFKFKKAPQKAGKEGFFKKKIIAVLVFEGAVVDGYSRRDPVMGQAVGSESLIPQIRKLRDDSKVKAVVFRINSGGGSAFASEDITAELRLLAEEKPLIISMSEVAGSGGYWMSCCGRKTFAQPTTLTGSIGVISIYLGWKKLFERIGLTHDTIRFGEHADSGSPWRELSDKEKEILEQEIEEMYQSFIGMVAEARGKSREDIEAIAQGRVWPGSSALSHGLIDEAGGLSDSIASAAAEADLKNAAVRFYPEVKYGLVERLIMNISHSDDTEAVKQPLSLISALSRGGGLKTGPLALMEEVLLKWN
ncbi:MAG: signal peptide peptidase SppA [Spirochaetales bacterium]|uniref:Signal peptide peptidase SppA n=1 Tax=Candidatus Thalassospirochaeta sargassi TaxID=3119039 RepID=A0AAJ1MIQ8_9SPIO|nr:signal peptide peptidase SppA [Spirochaetales bacterium]